MIRAIQKRFLHFFRSLKRPVGNASLGEYDGIAFPVDVIGQSATDTAIGTHAIDLLEVRSRSEGQADCPVHECAGRTGRRTFAAGHAAALAHLLVEVEGNARFVSLTAPTDDFVALHVVARSDAAIAENAGLMIDVDHLRAVILASPMQGRKARSVYLVVT